MVTPARLMRRWREDRYVQPAASDPRRLWRVESRLWDLLPEEFTGIELSPVAPLGTCSAVATVDQNRVVSTTRNSEVVSDPTNMLALEAAVRRKRNRAAPVNLAVCVRVLRAQPFHGEGLFQHFRGRGSCGASDFSTTTCRTQIGSRSWRSRLMGRPCIRRSTRPGCHAMPLRWPPIRGFRRPSVPIFALLILARFNDDAAATEKIWPQAAAAARQSGNRDPRS